MPSSKSSGVDMRGTWTPATAAAAGVSGVISAVPCTAMAVLAANSSPDTTYYLMLFDLAAVPVPPPAVTGRLPSIPLEAGQTVHVPLGRLVCANGLCWGASSTVDTYTPVVGLAILQVSAELV